MDNNLKITDEQVKEIYEAAEDGDNGSSRAKELKAAMKETENTNYNEIKILGVDLANGEDFSSSRPHIIGCTNGYDDNMVNNILDSQVDDTDNIEPTDDNIKDALNEYGIDESEILDFVKTINEFRQSNEYKGLYNKMPEAIKGLIDNLYSLSKTSGDKISKDTIAKDVLTEIVNESKFNNVMESYNKELNDLVMESNKEFQLLTKNAIDEVFDKIDEIEENNPEQAQKIKNIKQAFEDAVVYKKELDILDHMSAKKLKKMVNNYENECFYFNKKVNTTDINIPDIKRIYPIIKKALPGYTELQIKEFIMVICKASYTIDVNNIDELAYIYIEISNIIAFEYVIDFNTDYSKEVFGNISAVLTKIVNL